MIKMKNSVKKNLIIAAAAFTVIFSCAAGVLAATPEPAVNSGTNSTANTSSNPTATVRPVPGTGGTTSTGTVSDDTSIYGNNAGVSGAGDYRATQGGALDGDSGEGDNNTASGVTRAVPTPLQANPQTTMNVVAEAERTEVSNRHYATRGALAVWIIIAMLFNTVVSFWVGNRFYRMSKKDTHLTSEIRALRRDVEEKFLGSVGGFTEPEMDISNSNEDYSYEEDASEPQRQTQQSSASDDEAFRRWESQMNARTSRQSQYSETARRRKYQPEREEVEERYEEAEEGDGKSGLNSVKSRAKEFLGDIFPFNED